MTEERAVLAGGCLWGVQDLIRRFDGVLFTRVGYTGGSVPHATFAIMAPMPNPSRSSLILPASAIGRSSSSSSRFMIPAPAIAKATTSEPAINRRSSTPATSRGGSPKIRSRTSMLQACGLVRSLLKSFPPATSGRPNPNIRITSSDFPVATPVISSGPTGGFRLAPISLPTRSDSRSHSDEWPL